MYEQANISYVYCCYFYKLHLICQQYCFYLYLILIIRVKYYLNILMDLWKYML